MKKILAILVMVSLSGQAMSMGHPHNLFAARKHIKAKFAATSASKASHISPATWPTTQQVKAGICVGSKVAAFIQQVAH